MNGILLWSTEFDHFKRKIIHTFPSGRLVAIVDTEDDSLIAFKDGKKIKESNMVKMTEYYNELLEMAKADEELVRFSIRDKKLNQS